MKLAGLMLIILLSTTLGASIYERDRRKVRTLSLICSFIDEVYTGIRYTGSTVEEILLGCAENPTYLGLPFLKRIETGVCDRGMTGDILKTEILASAQELNLNSDEMQPLVSMSEKLGTTDIDGQLKMLDVCKMQIVEQRIQASKRCETLGKMYISLGLLFGLGTAVILA